MPRRQNRVPTKPVTYRINQDLAEKYELVLQDPVSKRGSYGKKSLIVERMLDRLLKAAVNNTDTIEVSDLVKIIRGN